MYEGRIRIICQNDLAETERVQRVVSDFCELHKIGPRVLHAIILTLDEVLTNIVRYAFVAPGPHAIGVWIEHGHGFLKAQIEDDGKPFDPLTLPPVDITKPLSDRQIGGLGVHLIRSLMSDVEYERREGKNVLTLTKRIP